MSGKTNDNTSAAGNSYADSAGSGLDYGKAYAYARKTMNEDPKIKAMESGDSPVDWDTIYDRLADAFYAGQEDPND